MKYIRTKQGHIYKRLYKDGALNRGVGYIVQGAIMPFGEDVIKESNSIEELCDEFVFIDEFFQRKHRLAYSLENALARCKYHDVDITTLRGAIWTNEGLIYVAKINEKGGLELL